VEAMEILTIQITNQKALKLLMDLEELSLIKVLKKIEQPQQKLSDKYAGKLPAGIAAQLQQHINESRTEWERNI